MSEELVKNCLQCGNKFRKHRSYSIANFIKRAKYCSKNCKHSSLRGKPSLSPNTKFTKENCRLEKHWNWQGGISKTREYKNFYHRKNKIVRRKAIGYFSEEQWEALKKKFN